MLTFLIVVGFVVLCTTLLFLRVISLLPVADGGRAFTGSDKPDSEKPSRLLIVLGSGGHTAEMLAILSGLNTTKFTHRSYVVSSGDAFSVQKAKEFEIHLEERNNKAYGAYDVQVVPRARKIHQSLLTTPLSSLACLRACIGCLYQPGLSDQGMVYPDIIITNGPGTGVIVVLASYMLRFLGWRGARGEMRTIYIESWARVRRLSLSGKILFPVVNRFIVQWETLARMTGDKAEYLGVLV